MAEFIRNDMAQKLLENKKLKFRYLTGMFLKTYFFLFHSNNITIVSKSSDTKIVLTNWLKSEIKFKKHQKTIN